MNLLLIFAIVLAIILIFKIVRSVISALGIILLLALCVGVVFGFLLVQDVRSITHAIQEGDVTYDYGGLLFEMEGLDPKTAQFVTEVDTEYIIYINTSEVDVADDDIPTSYTETISSGPLALVNAIQDDVILIEPESLAQTTLKGNFKPLVKLSKERFVTSLNKSSVFS